MSSFISSARAGSRIADFFALACCALFVAIGMISVSSLGIQTDEALFAAGIYPPFSDANSITIFHHKLPLMVMNYVGTAKSLLYWPILSIFPPSAYVVRIPVLIIGALTIWLFYCLLCRSSGVQTAVVGCILLATDPMFLLTTRYDWGPVAIQHFCLVVALLAVLRFYQEDHHRWLALGSFSLGVGMWDKALFGSCLVGISVAVVMVFPRQVRLKLRLRSVCIACACIALGALPLIIFNVRQHGATFGNSVAWSDDHLVEKALLLRETVRGAALYGYIAREDSDGPQRQPSTRLEHAITWLDAHAGGPRTTLGWYLLVASVLALPFAVGKPGGSAALFAAAATAFAWVLMLFTRGAGVATHHIILLWPLPTMSIAAALSACAGMRPRIGKAVLILIIGAAAISNLLVTGTYYAQEIRNGGYPAWTDAFYPMSAAVRMASAKQVCLLDWGFFDNLRFIQKTAVNLSQAEEPASSYQQQTALAQISDGNNLFVMHSKGCEMWADRQTAFLSFAAKSGYERDNIQVFRDRNGRACIELFRFARQNSVTGRVDVTLNPR